ncbi:hypothetical protein BKA61DRAFT_648459 [Leptodontidium sp. MPI-SDFR-AT-0119]|nr:hypothetical protein BKA61DRAFT_648459 [Leptodontidium sp. MPI-SDFR-AT-0119]
MQTQHFIRPFWLEVKDITEKASYAERKLLADLRLILPDETGLSGDFGLTVHGSEPAICFLHTPVSLRKTDNNNVLFPRFFDSFECGFNNTQIEHVGFLSTQTQTTLQLQAKMNRPPRRGRSGGRPKIIPTIGTPAGKRSSNKAAIAKVPLIPAIISAARIERSISSTPAPSSSSSPVTGLSQLGLVLDSININNISFEEYMNMANGGGTAGNDDAPAVEIPDTPMTGTEVSIPDNEVGSAETSSCTLRKKLLAARTTTPSSSLKSALVNKATVTGPDATPVADVDIEEVAAVSAVEDLLSRYPELLKATSKADIVDTIARSNVVNAMFKLGDARTYPIDYAQIEALADDIIARSTIDSQGPAKEKQAVLDGFDFGDKDSDVDNDDPVANQEEKVLWLKTVLAEKLNARHPTESSSDPFTSAEDLEAVFREQATSLKFSMFLNKSLSAEDGKLLTELREFDSEEETLRLLKEAAENAMADENALTEKEETPEEIHRRNLDFLAQDNPMSIMLFDENYVERYSNDEDISKIRHMLNPNGPLYQEYHRKKELRHKVRLEEENARKLAEWKVGQAAMVQRHVAMAAAQAAGRIVEKVPEDDFFFTFGK